MTGGTVPLVGELAGERLRVGVSDRLAGRLRVTRGGSHERQCQGGGEQRDLLSLDLHALHNPLLMSPTFIIPGSE